MRFETEKSTLNFIKFNSHEIEKETGKHPQDAIFALLATAIM